MHNQQKKYLKVSDNDYIDLSTYKLIRERDLVLNDFKGSQDNYNKWLYTAITRAKKSVTIVDLH